MEHLLVWLEETRLSVAIAGSQYLYPAILAAHGVGMALVVGLNTAVSLRVLGVASALPLAGMVGLYPIMWAGLLINAVTGVLLTMAAATRVLVDPVFFCKITFVTLAVVNMMRLKRAVLRHEDDVVERMAPAAVGTHVMPASRAAWAPRMMAVASILLWGAAITLGRLMGYTFFRFWQ
jgi:hypothetical protein